VLDEGGEPAALEAGEDTEGEVTEVGGVVDTDVTLSGEVDDDVGIKGIDVEVGVADAGAVEVFPEACRLTSSAARRTSSRTLSTNIDE